MLLNIAEIHSFSLLYFIPLYDYSIGIYYMFIYSTSEGNSDHFHFGIIINNGLYENPWAYLLVLIWTHFFGLYA